MNDKKVQKRIARVTIAVMRSSNADLVLLTALCNLEVQHRELYEDVEKMEEYILTERKK